MSEHGSFVTEYIFCRKCLEGAKGVLLKNEKYLRGIAVPMWGESDGELLPIIAGKIGGLYRGEEIDWFQNEIAPELAMVICCPMRVAVLAECGERIFTVQPEAYARKYPDTPL